MSLNRYIHIIAVLVLSVLLLGCHKDETPIVPGGESVRLEAEISKKQSADNTKATPSTDLAAGQFEVNDEFGFYLKSTQGYNTGNSNAKYVASKNADDKIVYTSANPLYYFDYDLHSIYGYYPYVSANSATNIVFETKKDQRGNSQVAPTLSNYTLSDLMWSSKINVKPQTKFDEAIKLTFDHKLSNVIVTLKNRTDAAFSGPLPRIWLRNVVNKLTLNVETGALDVDVTSKSDIELVPYEYIPEGDYLENTTTEIHYRAIAVPQNFVSGASVLKVNTNNVTYQVKTSSDLTFKSGLQYQIDVTNLGVDIRFAGCSVNEWGSKVEVDGGTIGGDGVLPCVMLFNVSGDKMSDVAKAVLYVDGLEYVSTSVNLANNVLKVVYDQGTHWGNVLTKVTFFDSSNNELNTNQTGETLSWEILGDPTDVAYDTIIGDVIFN